MNEHAAHLPHCKRLVGKELQSLLTEDHVDGGVLQSKIERAAFDPLDWCTDRRRERSRDRDHCRVQIDTNDPPGGTDTLGRNASHYAGPTSNVQHTLSGHQASG